MNQLTLLLKSRTKEIVTRENHNDTTIYLYSAGDYWVAFEKSAYQLSMLHPDCQIYPIITDAYPFPIVMASVPLSQLQPTSATPDFSTLPTTLTLSPALYQEWHDEEVCVLED
jgi:hypothetical protein